MQHLLWTNRAVLGPATALLLLRHLKPAAEICMHFARHQSPVALTNLVAAMDAILDQHLPKDDNRDLILSCEGLSGHLPGWPGVDSYAAAPITAAFLAGYLSDRIPDAELRFVYSTRVSDDWLYSAWRHHLFGQRLLLDWPAFAERYRGSADLAAILAETADAVAPIPVFDLPLDVAVSHPVGPGGALLELLDLPADIRSAIRSVGHGNQGPDATLAADFLALNRSPQPDDAVRLRKVVLAEERSAGGWARTPGPVPRPLLSPR